MKIKPVIILLTVAWAALIVACDGRVQRDTWDADMLQVRDSIDARNFEAAHRLIDQHLATAPDSDTYYGWLVSKNYAWYSAMKDDSFLVTCWAMKPNPTRSVNGYGQSGIWRVASIMLR